MIGVSVVDAGYAAARWGWYLAAFLVVGAGSYAPFLFRGTSFPSAYPALGRELTRRGVRVGLWAALALVVLALVRLYLQARTLNEPGEPLTAEFVGAVLGSNWGKGWIRQAAAAVVSFLGFGLFRWIRGTAWLVILLGSIGIAVTAGMTGHANTVAAGRAGWLIDAAHVLAGALWLGGLGILVLAGLPVCATLPPAERRAALRLLVGDFSRRALVVAPLTVFFGVWLAIRYLGWRWPLTLPESSYGIVLAGKLVALGLVGALGAYNWRITQPRLSREGGERRLRKASALELTFGVLLIAVTAVLIALPLPEGRM